MLEQLFSRIADAVEPQKIKVAQVAVDSVDSREHLYRLLLGVQNDIQRAEALFNLAEDEALIDNSIYALKSLRSQQQYIVQNIRRLEFMEKNEAAAQGEEITNDTLPKEGFAMG